MVDGERRDGDDVPEGFTPGLAVVDCIPVVEFCASMVAIAARYSEPVFIVGAALCALAGCGKVLWKVIIACAGRNISWLNGQFRYLMGVGFVLMLVSVVVDWAVIHPLMVLRRAFSFPSGIFFALGIAGMVAMGVMGARLDGSLARNNWIEQMTNSVAQAMVLIGILLY